MTIDVLEDPHRRQPGGGAFYSALQAARLGLRTLVITRGNPRELELLLEPYRAEIELHIQAATSTTTFATSWHGHERRQRLLSWAGPIEEPRLDADILHLAAVARETPERWEGAARFVGLTPQGLLRSWHGDGRVRIAPTGALPLPERLDAVVLSRSELPAWEALASAPAPPVLAVTAGPGPTTFLAPGREPREIPMPAIAQPLEDLGAGDIFAAALFISLRQGRSLGQAAAWAGAAAGIRIEGRGPGAVGDRLAITGRAGLSLGED